MVVRVWRAGGGWVSSGWAPYRLNNTEPQTDRQTGGATSSFCCEKAVCMAKLLVLLLHDVSSTTQSLSKGAV